VECNNQILRNFFQGLEVKEDRPRGWLR
jgi:hypothetical protein